VHVRSVADAPRFSGQKKFLLFQKSLSGAEYGRRDVGVEMTIRAGNKARLIDISKENHASGASAARQARRLL